MFLPKPLGEDSSFLLPASGSLRHSLVSGNLTLVSASVFFCLGQILHGPLWLYKDKAKPYLEIMRFETTSLIIIRITS